MPLIVAGGEWRWPKLRPHYGHKEMDGEIVLSPSQLHAFRCDRWQATLVTHSFG